jgi:hypothetical protein
MGEGSFPHLVARFNEGVLLEYVALRLHAEVKASPAGLPLARPSV